MPAILRGRRAALLAASWAALALGASDIAAGQPPTGDGRGGVALKPLGSFERPVFVTGAPGRKNRRLVFVVEQEGAIKVVRRGKVLARPFLDIRSRVRFGGEEGLLSIAFAHDYNRSRTFYAYLTNTSGNIEVLRVKRSKRARARAIPRSARRVIEIPHPGASNHNGGTVAVGPDRKLWLATGDGGGSCDPGGNAQSAGSLLGKLLRIEPRRKRGYRIPGRNPLANAPGRGEIWSLGLRNPFRFAFDRRTGALSIADVGQSAREELNHLTVAAARGANFGWNALEGTRPSGCPGAPPPPAGHTPPIHEYPHSAQGGFTGCSITGGVVVRDPRLRSLYGRYLYGDFCRSEPRSLIPHPAGARDDRPTGLTIPAPTSFGEGFRGRVFASSHRGQVYRLIPASGASRQWGG
jgi:hypothetical protein